MKAGDTTDIYARIQNYSNVDVYEDIAVRFYLGDPDNGGELIENMDGQSEVVLDQINAREPVVAALNNWIVPASINDQASIFAVIDPDEMIEEVHENNNKAWSLLKQGAGITGIEDRLIRTAASGNEPMVKVSPNPAQNVATFTFALHEPSQVTIHVYDLQGKLVKTLYKAKLSVGTFAPNVNIGDLKKGIYIYRFTTQTFSQSGKIVMTD